MPEEANVTDKKYIGLQGHSGLKCEYEMRVIVPFADAEERQWMLDLIDMFRWIVEKAPIVNPLETP